MGILEEKEDVQLEVSNIFLDIKSLKFPKTKIIYDDCDIKIKSSYLKEENLDNNNIKDLKNILSKKSSFKCSECDKDISSFEFFIKKESNEIIICNDCHNKKKEQKDDDKFISLDKYITTCDKHEQGYESFCVNCKKNICSKCKEGHLDLGLKHEIFEFDNILDNKELYKKINLCKKVKILSQIFKSISEIKFLESKIKEARRYYYISHRFLRENKFAEIMISTLDYFMNKKSLCYEIIYNFNEIKYNKELNEINIQSIFDSTNKILEPCFHIINQSLDITEIKHKIIPLSERNKIISEDSLSSEIRGIIELKDGYYLLGSLDGDIGIYDKTKLELKQKLRIEGINKIYHLEKIKHKDLDLIAIASDLKEIIIISVSKREKEEKENIFNYKNEFRKQEHTNKINRIIQLSNGLIVSSSEDTFIIIWKIIKNENNIHLESISKIQMDMDVHVLIEIPLLNELLCNNVLIDLGSFSIKRKLNIRIEEKNFNCSVCLFKEKLLAYVDFCDGISVINIETGKGYYIKGKYDYVDAVYTIDNETFCLCTKDLHDIFGLFGGRGLSQQYKLDEDEFEEIGRIIVTGVCNCFMTDSENNFIMGTMSGNLLKFTLK